MEVMDAERFGKLIRQRRDRAGIKTLDLAYRIGRQQSYVSKLEAGDAKTTPPPDVLDALSRELGVSTAEMLEALGYHIARSDEADALMRDADVMEIARAVAMMDQEQRDAVRRLAEILIQRMPRSG